MDEMSKGKTSKKPNTEKKEAPGKKAKMTWTQKLAQLPEDEARAVRAKAAEASRRSKAKKRGTTPEQAAVERLEAKLAKNQEAAKALDFERDVIMADLDRARAALAAAEKEAATDKEAANA